MSDETEPNNGQEPQDFLEQILRSMLGPGAGEEAAQAIRDQGFDLSALGAAASPQAMAQAMSQFRFLMSSSNDPVNWRMVEDIGRQASYKDGDPRITAAEGSQARQALSVADLWLDPVTDFVLGGGDKEAWTRVEWIDQTLPAWKEIVNPIALNVSRAMTETMSDQFDGGAAMGLPEQLQGMMGSLQQMLPKMAAMSFGAQVGQALAAMAKESLGTSDSGLPLTPSGVAALVPTNVKAFAEGLDDDFEVVQQYVAVREMAYVRLLAGVPWLRHDLSLAIIRYAEEIDLDTDAITEAARSIDPRDPESLNRALSGGVFAAEPTESQRRALERIEALLSLIEGWVEVVTAQAVAPYLPGAGKLQEMMRRRRVTGSSADLVVSQLIGIRLRPSQARNAAQIFRELEKSGGKEARDALWAHPDAVPTWEDLKNPEGFSPIRFGEQPDEGDDFDRDLERLLAGTLGWDDSVPEEHRSAFGTRGDDSERGSEHDDGDEDA